MKILLVTDTYPTLGGAIGVGVYTRTAAQGLAALGHEVHVLLGRHGVRSDASDGPVQVHVRRVRWLPLLGRWLPGLGESLGLAWAVHGLNRRYRLDVVEFPNYAGMGFVSALLRLVPVVLRLHTMTLEILKISARPPTRGDRFTLWMERVTPRLAQALVTHSRSHRQWIEEHIGLRDVPVIPHGIALPPRAPPNCNGSRAVLYVGALNPRKGIPTLLSAFVAVRAQLPEAELWVVGHSKHGEYETAFRQAHPDIPAHAVQFLGHVPQDELHERYARCAVFASASVYESFGLTFVEAMARARPVVACDVSAMPEVIRHGQTGLLVPPGDAARFADAILTLLRDDDLRLRLGEQARLHAERSFSAARMAKEIEDLYARVGADQTRPA